MAYIILIREEAQAARFSVRGCRPNPFWEFGRCMNERPYQTDTLRQNLESVMTTYMRFAQENQDPETTKNQGQTSKRCRSGS